MKSVYLDGKRVVVAGFASLGEADSVKQTIKESWPCCEKKVSLSFKPGISAVVVIPPTLAIAKEIMETMGILFSIPISSLS